MHDVTGLCPVCFAGFGVDPEAESAGDCGGIWATGDVVLVLRCFFNSDDDEILPPLLLLFF